MLALLYFDTEDYFSPPDSPAHSFPRQLAEVMAMHRFKGCFHIIGEKARFMEHHRQVDVIDAISRHDVSLHFDRGSLHPTTAEEVSSLDWFKGVDRAMFREAPGFQTIERVFGKCSALTQHGASFAAQIVYAAGRMNKPFFHSPFRLPSRDITWFCNNLLIGGSETHDFMFQDVYNYPDKFDAALAKAVSYLERRSSRYDYTALFGCHPVRTLMTEYPDTLNFSKGICLPPEQWIAPRLADDIFIPRILASFEKLIVTLSRQPGITWTTVKGVHDLYRKRPIIVRDRDIRHGAEAVVANRGPSFTNLLSAGELLFLLARRIIRRTEFYKVPYVMGPVDDEMSDARIDAWKTLCPREVAAAIVNCVTDGGGYLPSILNVRGTKLPIAAALMFLAHDMLDASMPAIKSLELSVDAIPGVTVAQKNMEWYKDWGIHGAEYHQEVILRDFRRQCWTLKPAFAEAEYGGSVKLGDWTNPMCSSNLDDKCDQFGEDRFA